MLKIHFFATQLVAFRLKQVLAFLLLVETLVVVVNVGPVNVEEKVNNELAFLQGDLSRYFFKA